MKTPKMEPNTIVKTFFLLMIIGSQFNWHIIDSIGITGFFSNYE
jgi:hypothetical protein